MFLPMLLMLAFQPPTSQPRTPEMQREMWNDIFANNKMKFRAEASKFVERVARGRKPGRALDLGMGTGRNALYLASEGWETTGVDISDVAAGKANETAKAAKLKIETVVQSLDTFDPGEGKWDLVVLSFMQFWVANAAPEKLAAIAKSLAPGGLLAIEGFAAEDAPGGPRMGYQTNFLLKLAQPGMRVVEYTDAKEDSDWKLGTRNRIMRIVLERER